VTLVRCVGGIAVALAGCGRIGFTDRPIADGSSGGDDGGTAQGWSKIAAYGNVTCGVFAGRAHCWGRNVSGQLGDGTHFDSARPHAVMLPPGEVMALSIAEGDGCAIVEDALYCWGEASGPTPVPIPLLAPATAVAVGRTFRCVIANGVQCWGDNDAGQLATGGQAPRGSPGPIMWSGAPLVAIEAGDDHTCALDDQMFAHCWGHNDNGSLGTGSFQPTSSLVVANVITTIRGLPQIAGWHACAVTNGAADCWGQGTSGELGDGGAADRAAPGPVPALSTGVTAIATGGGPMDPDASCAIMNGGVWCWGDGRFGRLGNGLAVTKSTPVAVVGLPGAAVAIAVGYGHACAQLADGDLWCWGQGNRGELGDGMTASSLTPVRVVDP
jgi:alpha-tubulin suppressor-like RCC1 family protein